MPPLARSQTIRLAVLIDAENASARLIEPLLHEVAKYGTANVKRIYGDWTTPNLSSWKNSLNKYAIQPIQQFRYTTGKNASDSALIIDAMDLLHSGNVDGFCIVSSDSDFTRLACRIRESGHSVYGFGEKKTPEPFVRACDRFIYVENLAQEEVDEEVTSRPKQVAVQPTGSLAPKAVQALGPQQMRLIRSAYDALAPEGGWITLAALGSQLLKLSPSFDSRTYGFQKLSELVCSLDGFKLDHRTGEGKTGLKNAYVTVAPTTED
jgi:Fe-S-cluster formation regulator IscX/YfhJ